MSRIQKTALGFLISSMAGTLVFFYVLAANTRLDRGNEWFSPEVAIIAITVLAVIGTTIAFVGWTQPHGKKVAIGGACMLVVYFFIYFASWSSEGGSSSRSTSHNSTQVTPIGVPVE